MNIFYKYRYIIAGGLVITFLGFYNNLKANLPPISDDELVVNVVAIPQKDVEIEKQYIGYVTPIQQAQMAANVSGYIEDVMVAGGDEVKTGDNLVLIDQREYKAEWNAAQAAVSKAEADCDNALSYYNRLQKAGKMAISAAELDNAKASYLSAKAALEQAKANEQKAKTAYEYTIVQAPIDGVVGNIDLTKGNYITPNAKLFSIVQMDPIRVVFAIPDKDFMHFASSTLKEPLRLRLADGEMYEQSGYVQYADNKADRSTNSISLYADFANPHKKLMANSYVDVFMSKKLKDASLIRKNYAQIKSDGIWAYIAKGDVIKQIKLKIEGTVDNFYATDNRFAKDEYLVVDKIGAIAPDTKVKLKIKDEGDK